VASLGIPIECPGGPHNIKNHQYVGGSPLAELDALANGCRATDRSQLGLSQNGLIVIAFHEFDAIKFRKP